MTNNIPIIYQRNTVSGFPQKQSVKPCEIIEMRLAVIPIKRVFSYPASVKRHDFIATLNTFVNNHKKVNSPPIPVPTYTLSKILCALDNLSSFLTLFFSFAFFFLVCTGIEKKSKRKEQGQKA